MMITTIEEARVFRAKIEASATHLPDEEAVQCVELFPLWKTDTEYQPGDRCRYQGILYRCYNRIAANPTWTPDVTPAHWEIVRPDQTGTKDDPITAAVGMRYYKGRYYSDVGEIYLCTRDDTNGTGTVLQYTPSQLVGIYFELVQ